MNMIDKFMLIVKEANAYHKNPTVSKKWILRSRRNQILKEVKNFKAFDFDNLMNICWIIDYGIKKYGPENILLQGFFVKKDINFCLASYDLNIEEMKYSFVVKASDNNSPYEHIQRAIEITINYNKNSMYIERELLSKGNIETESVFDFLMTSFIYSIGRIIDLIIEGEKNE